MSAVDPRIVSLVVDPPYIAAAAAILGSVWLVYLLLREALRLGYGMWVTAHSPDNAAEIIAATLRRSSRPWRKPTGRGG